MSIQGFLYLSESISPSLPLLPIPESHCVAFSSFEFYILLPQPPQSWDYMHMYHYAL